MNNRQDIAFCNLQRDLFSHLNHGCIEKVLNHSISTGGIMNDLLNKDPDLLDFIRLWTVADNRLDQLGRHLCHTQRSAKIMSQTRHELFPNAAMNKKKSHHGFANGLVE